MVPPRAPPTTFTAAPPSPETARPSKPASSPSSAVALATTKLAAKPVVPEKAMASLLAPLLA